MSLRFEFEFYRKWMEFKVLVYCKLPKGAVKVWMICLLILSQFQQ